MEGGPSHIDTFDLKPAAPGAKALYSRRQTASTDTSELSASQT
jgi:hypothetical protein